MRERFPDFSGLIGTGEDEAASRALRAAETTGRPLGAQAWIAGIEAATSRHLAPQKRGPRPKSGPGGHRENVEAETHHEFSKLSP
jgi:putative transposase